MRAAHIEHGIVTNIIVVEKMEDLSDFGGLYVEVSDGEAIGWSYDGSAFAPPPAPEDAMPSVGDYQSAIVRLLDSAAQARRYDNAVSISTYVASTEAPWAAEAAAFVAWRDAVWKYAYAELDKVMTGQRPQPTIAALIAELPAMTWPS